MFRKVAGGHIENSSFVSLSFSQRWIFFFASLPIYVILSVHNMLSFGSLTNENGIAVL